jgi:hypothetical protein
LLNDVERLILVAVDNPGGRLHGPAVSALIGTGREDGSNLARRGSVAAAERGRKWGRCRNFWFRSGVE